MHSSQKSTLHRVEAPLLPGVVPLARTFLIFCMILVSRVVYITVSTKRDGRGTLQRRSSRYTEKENREVAWPYRSEGSDMPIIGKQSTNGLVDGGGQVYYYPIRVPWVPSLKRVQGYRHFPEVDFAL